MKKQQLWICNRIKHSKGCTKCEHKYPHFRDHVVDNCDGTCGGDRNKCKPYKKGDEKLWTKN